MLFNGTEVKIYLVPSDFSLENGATESTPGSIDEYVVTLNQLCTMYSIVQTIYSVTKMFPF